jgi:hypothetical protein
VPCCVVVMKAGGTERPCPRRAQRRCSAGIRTQTNAAVDSGRAASGTRAPSSSVPGHHVCRYFANTISAGFRRQNAQSGRYRPWPTQRPIEGKAPPCVGSGLGELRREAVHSDSSERVNRHKAFWPSAESTGRWPKQLLTATSHDVDRTEDPQEVARPDPARGPWQLLPG